ncbi:MAG: aminomethyl-transferring glycine dehydrogenase subunit GcvPA [Acidobacteriota bacterium]
MLEIVGAARVDELFDAIPRSVHRDTPLELGPPMSEMELVRHLDELAAGNVGSGMPSFLGAGCAPHFVPSHVDALIQRQEYMTAYTPYQAEVGQGTLQSLYEFQSLVCMLTEMDVCNASVYDGASSVAEAVLMARRLRRRGGRVLFSEGLHPAYRTVAGTYATHLDLEFEELPVGEDGRTRLVDVGDDDVAVVVQQPNFFGVVEDLGPLAEAVGESAAKLVVATSEPLAFALAIPPGRVGADIVVGELRGFGNPMNFGGPLVGFMACRDRDKRNLPGRLVGETVDLDGKRGYVLTLSTREQHIRREKATSNICTNEALAALAACIHMCSLGRRGMRELAGVNLAKATYARRVLEDAGLEPLYGGPHFNEITFRVPGGDADALVAVCAAEGLLPGVALGRLDPAREDQLLVCATEVHERADIDRLGSVVREACR